jgi:hypothetical protein
MVELLLGAAAAAFVAAAAAGCACGAKNLAPSSRNAAIARCCIAAAATRSRFLCFLRSLFSWAISAGSICCCSCSETLPGMPLRLRLASFLAASSAASSCCTDFLRSRSMTATSEG